MNLRKTVLSLILNLPMGIRRRVLFVYYNRRLPRFRNPSSFNDKINWRIINDRRLLLEWTCDKLAMKERAKNVSDLNIPRTLWEGTDLKELDSITLPEHWVLKPNHRSGFIYFGHGRPKTAELSETATAWLRSDSRMKAGEWAYSKARSVLLVEEMVGMPGSPPSDYKFFVFEGKVAAIQVDVDRHTVHRRRIYFPDWSPLEVTSGPHELAPLEPAPAHLDRMIAIAEELGAGFDFMRVDLYNVDGCISLGEFTPYPGSGLDRFIPTSFDRDLGRYWSLPSHL